MKEKYKFMLYLLRWQLSTPILAICLRFLKFYTLTNTIIANLIGGIIFYWVDKTIFKNKECERLKKENKELKAIINGKTIMELGVSDVYKKE